MEQFTIQEIIDLADMSVSLSGNYQEKGNLFEKRLAYTAPQTIALVTDALRWQNEGQPTDNTLRGVANYLYWLCGKFALEAQFATDGISAISETKGATNNFLALPISFSKFVFSASVNSTSSPLTFTLLCGGGGKKLASPVFLKSS